MHTRDLNKEIAVKLQSQFKHSSKKTCNLDNLLDLNLTYIYCISVLGARRSISMYTMSMFCPSRGTL